MPLLKFAYFASYKPTICDQQELKDSNTNVMFLGCWVSALRNTAGLMGEAVLEVNLASEIV